MNVWLIPFAALTVLSLAAVMISLFSLFRAKAWLRQASENSPAPVPEAAAEAPGAFVSALESRMENLAVQLAEMREAPAVAVQPGIPKPGMNLTKRSHALRLHRQGDPPDRIAATLEIPLQEVDLLLKVHRIVLGHA